MGKTIRFCLVYRDMWQSSGKYMPRMDQLVKVAEPIIDMGCFARVETNGGGFEQINLLFGQNPNKSVRAWTRPFRQAGIQTQMLERGLNGIRMSPVPADIRRLMFQVKKKQGTDIARSFDGLNDPRNLAHSIRFAKEAGMVAQAALCITHSAVHTVPYYIELARELIGMGAEEICIKDMAGIGRPVSLGKMIRGIKEQYPEILIQYHGHSAPGFSVASSLEAARAGADIIDVGMEPLSWGTGHADLLTIHAMLKDAGFELPAINMKAYMKVRSLTQEFIDDFLGYYINPRNRYMNSLLIGPGLPGGMMGSLMADLENNLASLNKWLEKRGKSPLSQDELLIKLFQEVEYIWPKMGYPPLVTPYSQYVKNVALMNVMQMEKGRERWSMIDNNTWDMLLGKSGRLPAPIAEELKELAIKQGRKFYTGNPQDLYPDSLEVFQEEMHEKGWDSGQDEEDLMELAMHPQQFRAYKSGKAAKAFEEDLARRKLRNSNPQPTPAPPGHASLPMPKKLKVSVNGEQFEVALSYEGEDPLQEDRPAQSQQHQPEHRDNGHAGLQHILAPLEGKFYLTREPGEKPLKVGDQIKKGDTVGYIESMKVVNAIFSDVEGEVVEICFQEDEPVQEDDVLIKVKA
ncbi:MAG: oxaloacetate decarboxylase [Bacteroidetes bacterium]|nr:MAG: oxaloacetate decarboxylase [Bacteroidota bacterium]